MTWVKSITRMPASGWVAAFGRVLIPRPSATVALARGPVARIGALRAQRAPAACRRRRRARATPASSASAAATPAASPIAMQGGISRDIFCADEVAE